jgi:nucleoside phosphorylase
VAVLTVTEEEFNEVAAILQTNENILGTPYYVRKLVPDRTYDVVLGQLAGRGNVEAATAARKLIEDFRPPYILLVGVGVGCSLRTRTFDQDI